MCAIAGLIGIKPDRQKVREMLQTMARRGPDGQGVYEQQDCMLLHTRLAIIDLAGGAQPMHLHQGTEHYIISYNGELYNTEEIKRELITLGHSFMGHSDTEVLLHGYCQWGRGVLEKLNGIFAFAVWESHNRKLFLARDRMGVKPLFFAKQGDVLIFASELKTILASGAIEPTIDENGAMELLMLGPGRTPGNGVFRGIEELEPGCCAAFEDGKLTVSRYWKLTDRIHTESFEQTAEKVRWLVMDAIRRQMISDVPIGTFLSGGLDSSLITSVCASGRNEPLPSFSVDYKNNAMYFVPGKFQPNSDAEYISLMKKTLHTKHHLTVLTPEDLVNVLQDATVARDLPGMADVDFSLLAFCADIRKDVKVALSGECADEIFGGYPWYTDPEIRGTQGFPWAQNTEFRAALLTSDPKHSQEYVQEKYLQTIRSSDILPENSPQERRMKEMVNLNLRWFMQTLLDRKDRMSMYHGLEVRVPFCDHRIAEYLYSVPWEYKHHNGKEKGLLRYAAQGLLPEQVLWRKKSPYPKTHDPHYEKLVSAGLKSLLGIKNAPIWALVNRDAAERLLSEEQPWPWYGQLMRRPQTMAFLLQLDFWLREYRVKII